MKKKNIAEKKEKFFSKKRILTYMMGSFIILLMVASALNMWKGDKIEKYDYQGLKFTRTDQGLWAAYKGNQQVVLAYNPKDLEDIEIPENIGLLKNSQKIYLSTNDIKANNKVMDYFKRKIGITNSKPYACTEDVEGCEELPLKNCEDTTQNQAVIIFERAEETQINYKNNCLTMSGANENLTKAIDKLYFTLEVF